MLTFRKKGCIFRKRVEQKSTTKKTKKKFSQLLTFGKKGCMFTKQAQAKKRSLKILLSIQ
jgi:hypothetical protein